MSKVEDGVFVKLCFTGKLDDGAIFDKTEKCKPLEIQVGSGGLVDGFENAIIGMTQNEKKSFVLEPEEAYGERDESLERSYPRSTLALNFEPVAGQVILFTTESGDELPALVKSVDEEVLVLDFNHPLAGKSLTFEVEITGIDTTPSFAAGVGKPDCCCS
ncbi:MAG: peptidylprolyl isomerase [Syntrophobacteraceae bacterium]